MIHVPQKINKKILKKILFKAALIEISLLEENQGKLSDKNSGKNKTALLHCSLTWITTKPISSRLVSQTSTFKVKPFDGAVGIITGYHPSTFSLMTPTVGCVSTVTGWRLNFFLTFSLSSVVQLVSNCGRTTLTKTHLVWFGAWTKRTGQQLHVYAPQIILLEISI